MEVPKSTHFLVCLENNLNLAAFTSECLFEKYRSVYIYREYKFFATVHGAECMINDSNEQGEIRLKNRIVVEREECGGLPEGRQHPLLPTCSQFRLPELKENQLEYFKVNFVIN